MKLTGSSFFRVAMVATLLVGTWLAVTVSAQEKPPAEGDMAPNFKLSTLDGTEVELQKLLEEGPVVVVMLRGFPGYQCPLCTRQVGSLVSAKDRFVEKKAKVVLVYPGDVSDLNQKGKEFIGKTTLPENFYFVTDPDYKFTNQYGLRWDAPQETAYPSTFVVQADGKVKYAVISKSHGGRADTQKVLNALK